MRYGFKGVALAAVYHRLLLTAILSFMMIGLEGCTSTRCVAPPPAFLHDTVYQARIQHDSVYVDHFIEVSKMGDTVYRTRTEYVYRERTVHDTVFKVEEVPVEVPVYVEAEASTTEQRGLSWWQGLMIRLGWLFLGVVGVVGVFRGVRVWLKR